MARVRKATAAEKAAYQATGPVYPLYGYLKVDGHECVVEDLRGSWSKPDPVFEIIAPAGHWFVPEYCRHLLGMSLTDVAQRVAGARVEPTTDGQAD